ncbi:MAG: flagellar biosynthetic protein FliQ [Planctomycetaceae bacterium]|nr:flagellar biosynthetic protein FliQ [Planctomycetaceae bacterium]
MSVDQVTELGQSAIMTTLTIGAPMLIVALIVGLAVSLLQAVTQVQDQTISLVPKIIAVVFALMVFLPWIAERMVEYSTQVFRGIPGG